MPKELLPVVDTPGIELVAAEAAAAGAERLVIVTSEGKDGVVAHFVEDLVLEGTLEARGKTAMLAKVRRAPALIKVESVVQAEPLGLGMPSAVSSRRCPMMRTPYRCSCPTTWCCRPACWRRCRRCGPGWAARCCVPSRYPRRDQRLRRVRCRAGAGREWAANPNVLKVKGMVEKPKTQDAPSMFAAAGRYVLDRAIFDALRRIERGAGVKFSSPTRSRC
ncbi:putative uTP-glucose-1-phosphate uridylyltransferase [Mycobacterium ulcerans str. Harvey]|uniref:UTP-glucose-1-phosphate uridylyltransferase n=1 Tax=Mycobacterium ulcerans str. Harvey TaxID=1299332 RepID=A0ABP3A8N3_MYCUL|nr:putative uTP-glucose-1-phosphate uridylyltransferase [Mycobacterium ulcerans str. Harvey]